MNDQVDTGFDAVLAGEVYKAPDEKPKFDSVNPPISEMAQRAAGLTPEGVQAGKALVQLPPMTAVDMAKLAREMAMDIKERCVILKDFNLSEVQYDFLEANNEFYKSALHAACIEWHAPLSTEERIRIEAAAILEDSLPGLGSRMQNKAEGLPGVIEAAKFFARAAGVGERATGAGNSAERFTINIDLGGDQKIVVSAGGDPKLVDQASPLPSLTTIAGGAGGVGSVEQERKTKTGY